MVDIFKEKVRLYKEDRPEYIAMCKKGIEEKIDWHENAEYNHGKSANKRYLEDIFETHLPVENRNHNPMKRIFGKFGEFKETAENILGTTAKTKPMQIAYAVLGGLAVCTGAYLLYRNTKTNNAKPLDKVV